MLFAASMRRAVRNSGDDLPSPSVMLSGLCLRWAARPGVAVGDAHLANQCWLPFHMQRASSACAPRARSCSSAYFGAANLSKTKAAASRTSWPPSVLPSGNDSGAPRVTQVEPVRAYVLKRVYENQVGEGRQS